MAKKGMKILLSGGGTGGHIFPAVAIAQEFQRRFPDAEFLFIGANGKMEMQKVPQAGFNIKGLNIAGFDRGKLLKNIGLPFKLMSSFLAARKIIKNFRPDMAIGTGGFASGPALFMAAKAGVPTFVQEQNSLPGKTNIHLSKKARAVFTSYPAMEKFFPKTEVFFLGNPIRENFLTAKIDSAEAKRKNNLHPEKLTILSVGGSLGSKTLNDAWLKNLEKIKAHGWQLIWQTGKTEFQKIKNEVKPDPHISITEFISDMPTAYASADVIVSRAGAIAISELSVAAKPVLLVPFPYAAEDHQTKNAEALTEKNAAKMVKDSEMDTKFWDTLTELCDNSTLRETMSKNIGFFAKPDAARDIVDQILKMTENSFSGKS